MLIGVGMNQYIILGITGFLNNVESSHPLTQYIIPFISLISLSNVLYILMYEYYISLSYLS